LSSASDLHQRAELRTLGISVTPSRFWCAPNVLAFSCERTYVNSDRYLMVCAFVSCNGVLDGCAWGPARSCSIR